MFKLSLDDLTEFIVWKIRKSDVVGKTQFQALYDSLKNNIKIII